jgi:plastocyanin
MKRINRLFALVGVGFSLGLGACGSQEAAAAGSGDPGAATNDATAATAEATGTVIEVKMVTDGAGNYFEPAEIAAQPGDVVRFTLVSGVHNVSFPAASNAGVSALPEVSPYLQLPGQTHDLLVELPAGEYAFQCDPHAALGMVGKLTVR